MAITAVARQSCIKMLTYMMNAVSLRWLTAIINVELKCRDSDYNNTKMHVNSNLLNALITTLVVK